METEQQAEPTTALAIVSQFTAAQLFAPGALNPILEDIKAQVRAIKTDISTEDGRKALKSLVRKIASSKTFIDEQRQVLVGDEKKRLKAIDAEGLRVWNELEALQEEVRKPLTDWEASETRRKDEHEAMIKAMLDVVGTRFTSLEQVEKARVIVDQVWDRKFDEFLQRATDAHEYAMIHLNNESKRISEEAAAKAEQARLKAEIAEKERVEREAKIAEEARSKAEDAARRREEAQKVLSEQREYDLTVAAAEEKARLEREIQKSVDEGARLLEEIRKAERQAELDKIKAETDRIASLNAERKRAEEEREKAVLAERKRQDDERAAEEAKKAEAERLRLAREAELEHRRVVHKAACDALLVHTEGITSQQVRNIVTVIAKGLVPGVSITY